MLTFFCFTVGYTYIIKLRMFNCLIQISKMIYFLINKKEFFRRIKKREPTEEH